VSYKKRNEFLTNKWDLKNIEGKQHVFVCEDLIPPMYKLLKFMKKSCSDTFSLPTPELARYTSPDDLFKHGIGVHNKILSN